MSRALKEEFVSVAGLDCWVGVWIVGTPRTAFAILGWRIVITVDIDQLWCFIDALTQVNIVLGDICIGAKVNKLSWRIGIIVSCRI